MGQARGFAEARGFGEQLSERLRAARVSAGRRQEDVADDMRLLGFTRWTKATVAGIELGRRAITPEELSVLALVLDRPEQDLRDFEFVTPGGAVITREMVRAALTGDGMSDRTWVVDNEKDWPDEAETKAAVRLGLTVEDLQSTAVTKWGCSLSEERDRRLGDISNTPRRTAQARRGHITRQLLAELAEGRQGTSATQNVRREP